MSAQPLITERIWPDAYEDSYFVHRIRGRRYSDKKAGMAGQRSKWKAKPATPKSVIPKRC